MRAEEFLIEYKIHDVDVGNIHVVVDDHFRERAEQRGVHIRSAGFIIADLPKLDADIRELDPGQQFWVFDTRRNISLGFRKQMDKNGKMDITLMTALSEHNWEGQLPEFYL
jgi:hypothetical protein